jgi:potassium-transporting ATPase potassium-binding subunit
MGASYTGAILIFNLTGLILLFAILLLQGLLPLNPQGFGAVAPDLAFNTAVSFVTNTSWQAYAGETTLSYFSQMRASPSNLSFQPQLGLQ